MISINASQSFRRILPVETRLIKKVLQSVLKEHKHARFDLSLALVDNRTIRKLNRRYLKHNRITDVIAFPLMDDGMNGDKVLGEIVVSVEKAVPEARRRKITVRQELLLYCVHGLLHLLGYDDGSPRARRRMEKKQAAILSKYAFK
ncbi:MAG: rRNA maturation RNase YbeY [Planctomycetes bacterium]|nr:rRNA maturation RNase YbeY [Planctomycetota bacterium]